MRCPMLISFTMFIAAIKSGKGPMAGPVITSVNFMPKPVKSSWIFSNFAASKMPKLFIFDKCLEFNFNRERTG
jgi:hypothetical protein